MHYWNFSRGGLKFCIKHTLGSERVATLYDIILVGFIVLYVGFIEISVWGGGNYS